MSFECDKCGACCRCAAAISKIPELDRGDGTCRYLSDDNTCSIYDERPLICRVDATYEQFYSDTCSRDEYYRVTHECCKLLKQKQQ
jgi:Fe-S-cluster containining protein